MSHYTEFLTALDFTRTITHDGPADIATGDTGQYRIIHLFMHPKWSETPIANGYRVELHKGRRIDHDATKWFLDYDAAVRYCEEHNELA